nr:MAG TPA: hypothetical protein [Caudoviricetes sp.]
MNKIISCNKGDFIFYQTSTNTKDTFPTNNVGRNKIAIPVYRNR